MKIWKNSKGQLVMRSSGDGTKLYWSPAMLEKLKRLYPFTTNKELAAELGIGLSTLQYKVKELGLVKDPYFLHETRMKNLRYGTLCSRLTPKRYKYRDGKITDYIMNETPEQRKARIEKGRKTKLATRIDIARKGAETKRNWSEERKREFSEKMSQIRRKAIENGAVEKYKANWKKLPAALKERRNKNISIGKKNAKVS